MVKANADAKARKENEGRLRNPAVGKWKRLMKNKAAVVGMIIFILLVLMAIFADVIVDYDMVTKISGPRLQWPSKEHWFGTDEMGRDLFARVVHGSRISLLVGVCAVTVSVFGGTILGAISGFYGGKVDSVLMRFLDVILSIPSVMFAITIVAALGPSMVNMTIALSISGIPSMARVIRAQILSIKEQEYVEAARAIGAKDRVIIFSHILPNCIAPLIVQATMKMASTILAIASMSFLGLGAQPPTPEWGSMLSNGRTYIRDYAYITFFPGMAIVLTVLSLNMMGDGLRDALDPRLK